MNKRIWGFTLIELIIVIVIIGILAMVALPRYFANIKKARKAQVTTVLSGIREAEVMYYSFNNKWDTLPAALPGTLSVSDGSGEIVISAQVPANYAFVNPTITAAAFAAGEGSCVYTMNVNTGAVSTVTAGCP